MNADEDGPHPSVDHGSLLPYVSVLILEGVDGDTEAAFYALADVLRAPATAQTRKDLTLVAEGLSPGAAIEPMEEVLAFVHRVEQSPSWYIGPEFADRCHVLTLAARAGDLIALLMDRMWSDRMQSWLDRPGRPVVRVPDDVLRGAFLRGRAKGLWLRGQHASRANMPDSKAYSGPSLEQALNPHTEGSYGVISGRAELAARAERGALRGSVGTTPMKGLVWCRKTDSLRDFVDVVSDLFEEVRAVRTGAEGIEDLFPDLAVPVHDPAVVRGAFDLGIAGLADVPGIDVDQDSAESAAAVLDRVSFEVVGSDSPDFGLTVRVGDDVVGRVDGRLELHRRRWVLFLDVVGADPRLVDVHGALLRVRDLLTVRYRSGHAYSNGEVLRRRIRPARFPRWSFRDFTGFRVDVEKPPPDVHENVGTTGDESLFGWVVREYSTGHLTCDDGAGEVADFVHVAPDGTLTLVHVKRADSASPGRRIAAVPYEQVVGQAAKNLALVEDPALLAARLGREWGSRAATWQDGRRVADRSGLLAALQARDATSDTQVVVLQPHVQRSAYVAAIEQVADPPRDDTLRLYLLESMLNAAAGDVAGAGAEFAVIGSDT